MKIRPWATFHADFPDDYLEDEERIIQFGGKNVAEAIAELLTALGYRASEPISAEERGWEIDLDTDDRSLWFRVTDLGDRHALLAQDPTFLAGLFGQHPAYLKYLRELHAALTSDPRFKNIVWWPFNKFEEEGKGAAEPIGK